MYKTIQFNSSIDFSLSDEKAYVFWIDFIVGKLGFSYTEINYHFCSDEELLAINIEHLNHDTFTDIITFDYSFSKTIQTDIFISIDRIKENAFELSLPFNEELRRVMAHGILHCCGFKDKTTADKLKMREKEDECMKMFHVEQKQN